MTAYYNEIDPYAAQWLRNLIAAGHIAPGVVDERSIEDVTPDDLHGFTQCHFFAGIGVWSYALRRAGWRDDEPVWTGSCPCQPFSEAGRGGGFADERHLWPAWFHLIQECRPATVFGEQVASPAAHPWLDLVADDLEGVGYAFGAVVFPAASIGAPHIRHRAYFVAYAARERQQRAGDTRNTRAAKEEAPSQSSRCGNAGRMANADCYGRQGRLFRGQDSEREAINGQTGCDGATRGFWSQADWLYCRDGKLRPVEPGTFPLAHGAPTRVGRLRAYGNAINAEAAAEFIRAARG